MHTHTYYYILHLMSTAMGDGGGRRGMEGDGGGWRGMEGDGGGGGHNQCYKRHVLKDYTTFAPSHRRYVRN